MKNLANIHWVLMIIKIIQSINSKETYTNARNKDIIHKTEEIKYNNIKRGQY